MPRHEPTGLTFDFGSGTLVAGGAYVFKGLDGGRTYSGSVDFEISADEARGLLAAAGVKP